LLSGFSEWQARSAVMTSWQKGCGRSSGGCMHRAHELMQKDTERAGCLCDNCLIGKLAFRGFVRRWRRPSYVVFVDGSNATRRRCAARADETAVRGPCFALREAWLRTAAAPRRGRRGGR
jgi:hypothetical protein